MSDPTPSLTREESAFFMKTFWTALCTPTWPRHVLIDLGTLVHEKLPLAKFNDKQLSEFLPLLRVVTENFGTSVLKESTRRSTPIEKDEVAFLIRTIWDALCAPAWNKDDLIELGKCVFARLPLAKIGDRQFEVLFPYLTTIANQVGLVMLNQGDKFGASPAPTSAPNPTPASPPLAPEKSASPTPQPPSSTPSDEKSHG